MRRRLLFVPTSSVSGLYGGFMDPAEKQSLAGFNPGNIFKLRLARQCLLPLACCCFPHAALQSSPPLLFILLHYLSVDIFFFILTAKKKNQWRITTGTLFNSSHDLHSCLLSKKERKKLQFHIIKQAAIFAAAAPELYLQRCITQKTKKQKDTCLKMFLPTSL